MPTTFSLELSQKITRWFGSLDKHGPICFLLSRGYDYFPIDDTWQPPVSAHTISLEEEACLTFLVDAYHHDGIRGWDGRLASSPSLATQAARIIADYYTTNDVRYAWRDFCSRHRHEILLALQLKESHQ